MNKKTIMALLAVLTLSLSAALAAGAYIRKTPVKSVVSMYADGDGGYWYIEINNSRYSWFHLDEYGGIVSSARLKAERKDRFYSCNGIVADEAENVYVASYEKDNLQKILLKYVLVFDKDGKKVKKIFETPLEEKPDETEKLKSLQYSNGKVSMFEMLGEGRLLFYVYDCETGIEERTEYVIQDGAKMSEAHYGNDGLIYFTTDMGRLYQIDHQNETNEILINYPQAEKVIPLRLSYNEGVLYFTDVHNFTFAKYDLAKEQTELVYDKYGNVGCGKQFSELRFVRWYGGELYGHSPIFENSGYLMRISGEPNIIGYRILKETDVLKVTALVFILSFSALSALVWVVRLIKSNRSLLVKQALVMALLISAPIVFMAVSFDKMFMDQIENELHAQLYGLSIGIAAYIDGHTFRGLDFPNDIRSGIIKDLDKRINVRMDGFKHPNEGFIPKNLYYTLYTIKDGIAYHAYGFDYLSGMRDEYILKDANSFFENNPEYEPRWVEYSDKYGQWLTYRAFILDEGEPVGLFETGARKDVVDKQIFDRILSNTVKALVIAAACIVILAFTLKRFLKGLKTLKEGLGQMTDGDWHVRIRIKTGDEIEDIANDFNRMASRIEKYVDSVTRLNAAYKKFVPNELFELLDKKNIFEVKLGDQAEKNLTLMSVSVRDFHSVSRNLSSRECFDILNGVFAASSRAIRNKGGFIESFGGFGLRAVFTNETDFAINAALRIIEKINAENKEGGACISLSITVQSGDAMLGIAGDSERMAETVISETARNIFVLEKLSEKYQINLLVAEEAFRRIAKKEKYNFSNVGTIKLEGGVTALYDFNDAYEAQKKMSRIAAKEDFEKGLTLYKEGLFIEARKKFAEVLRLDNSNEIAKTYLFRCESGNPGVSAAEGTITL